MASDICIDEQYLWVTNRRLRSLIGFALEVGSDTAESDDERRFVENLKTWDDTEHWPGCSFDLNERFPNVEEKKFWTRCFHDVAGRIFRREIGNQDIEFWQSSAIGDAYITARMLNDAVRRETKTTWHPETEDCKEAKKFMGGINVRL